MKKFRELSFATPNKPGSLAKVLNAIAREGINITAVDSSAGFDFNLVRLVFEDTVKVKPILVRLGYAFAEETVLGVALADRPGQLARLTSAIGEARINIDYLYAASGGREGEAMVFCHVPDITLAEQVIKASGVEVELAKV